MNEPFAVGNVFGVIIGLAILAGCIYVAVDASKYSNQAHTTAGIPRMLWIVGAPILGVLSLCCCFLGLIPIIGWFGVYRSKADQAQNSSYNAGYGVPMGYPAPGAAPGFGTEPAPPPGGFGTQPPPPGPGGFGTPPPPPGPGGFGTEPPPPPGGFPPQPGS